jgi:hypothetical protein
VTYLQVEGSYRRGKQGKEEEAEEEEEEDVLRWSSASSE